MADVITDAYAPYLPRLATAWHRHAPGTSARAIDGSLVSVDVSGFTALSERLAARGKIGAEELIALISRCYDGLIRITLARGGDVLKFRGDALLLFFEGSDHEERATVAALEMQAFIDEHGRAYSSVGPVTLGMSVGIHAGTCHFFLVGSAHKELIVCGPAASAVLALEDAAERGEVLVGARAAEALDPAWLGGDRDGARLVRRDVELPQAALPPVELDGGHSDLSELMPPPLRAVLAAGSAEPEHRQATAAFVKFSGTDLLVGDEAEAARQLDALARVVSDTAADHAVTWLESDIDADGGKLYLVAGAPESAGGDEERMLRTLRAILDAGVGPPIAAGVNRGHVFAGEIGAPERRTYAVMGDTVNLAARLTSRAQKGKILATGGVLERSRARFDAEPQQFLMKGKEKPVTAFHVGALVGAGVEQQQERLPIVGRESELRVLREALDAARMRQTRVVELVGDPGIGKSRLVDELKTLAVGFQQLESRSEQYAASTPYFALRSLLRPLVGIRAEDGAEEAGVQLTGFVAAAMPDLAPWLPLLAIPFDADVPPTPETDEIDPTFRQRRLHEVVDQFLTRMLLMPTLLVFEDAHWMDDASGFLLRHLTSQPLPRPWLVCVTRRPGGGAFPGAAVVELEPLTPEHAAQLALAAAGDVALPPDALDDIAARSGGNPLFLRELVAAGPQSGDDALPETVETMITARLDTLDSTDRLLLRCAAVIGPSFDLDLLSEVLASESIEIGDPDRWNRLNEFVGWEDAHHLRFRHDLFRTVGYEGLSFARRRQLHGLVGEALERRAGETGEEVAALLSLHFLEAAEYDKAWGYAVVAGDRARERFANVDAAELYARALRAAGELTPDAEEVARVGEALGDVAELAARYETAEAAYADALRLMADDPYAQARLQRKQGILCERAGRYDDALEWYARGLGALRRGEDRAAALPLRAVLELEAATIRFRQGRFADCLRWSRRAAKHAERAGDRRALAHAYRHMAVATRHLGLPEESLYERALAMYEEIGDLEGQSIVLNNLGVRAYFAGKWTESRELYGRSRAAAERAGNVVRGAWATINSAEILLDQGHVGAAAEQFELARRIYAGVGHVFGAAVVTMNFGRIAAREQRFDDAYALLDEARTAFDRIGSAGFVLETDARRAECLVLEGRHREAFDVATATLEHTERVGEVAPRTALLERLRGYAKVQGREPELARPHFDESLRAARDLEAEYELALTMHALAQTGASEYAPLADVVLGRLGVVATPYVPLP